MRKFLGLFFILTTLTASAANVPISALPIGTATTTNVNDSFPFVSTPANVTKRMTIWDIVNIPTIVSTYAPLSAPHFVGNVTATGNITATGTIGGSNFSGTTSGTNTGDVTLSAFGSSPSANGASLSGQALTLQPADDTHPGGVSILAQIIAGAKTFSTAPILSSLTASLPLQLDASKNITSTAIDLSGSQATGVLAAGRFPALTGDITTSSGALATTLATVNTNVGTFGTASAIPAVTVNGKGLITAISTNAVVAPTVGTTATSTSAGFFPTFVSSSTTGNQTLGTDSGFSVNPSTHNVTATTFTGALAGNATTATTATNATNIATTATNSTNATFFPAFVAAGTSGNQGADTATGLTFNPSTNTLATTTFSGALSGNSTTATTATNIAGGAGGSVPYQSAAGTTVLLANGSSGQVLTSAGGTSAPSWASPAASGVALNYAPNPELRFWQRIEATATTIANTVSTYGPDQVYAKNSLGTNGVLTISQVAATNNQSRYACKLLITTAPTAAQTNGTELYFILGNSEMLPLLGQIISVGINVKAFGNVNQVGIQPFYATSRTKLATAIGSEGTATVNTSTFTQVSSLNTTLTAGTITTSGVVGFRVRITTVSSGNTYDLNNGFSVELPIINIGATLTTFNTREPTPQGELLALQKYYYKTFPQGTAPVQNAGLTGAAAYGIVVAGSSGQSAFVIYYPTIMDATPTITSYNPSNTNNKPRNTSTAADWASFTNNNSNYVNMLQTTGSPDAGSGAGQGSFVHITSDAGI